jgi:tRNA threonylcarbamoyladenosine biosynthesis protein TsaB
VNVTLIFRRNPDMPYILYLETATKICSVAVAKDESLISLKETSVVNSHSSLITVFAEQCVKDANIEFNDLDAICVSMGPGSYTGLRIGVSTAKGFCYALDIPLIAVNTLQSMAKLYSIEHPELKKDILLCPMIDARRMEVFTAFFDMTSSFIRETQADIIDENSYSDILSKNSVIFFGDGSDKCRQALSSNSNILFDDTFKISAKGMIPLSIKKFRQKQFEDVAYFEPYYLKDFIATIPKKFSDTFKRKKDK